MSVRLPARRRIQSGGREWHPGWQIISVVADCAEKVCAIRRYTCRGARCLNWRRGRKAKHSQKNSTCAKHQSHKEAWIEKAGSGIATFHFGFLSEDRVFLLLLR